MAPVLDLDFTDKARQIAIKRHQVSSQTPGTYFCTLPGCEHVQYTEDDWLRHFINFHNSVLKDIKRTLKHEVAEANVVSTPTNFEQPEDSLLDDNAEELTKDTNFATYLGKSKKARRTRYDCDVVVSENPKKAKYSNTTAVNHKSVSNAPMKPLFVKTCSGAINRTATVSPTKAQTLWEEQNVSHFPQLTKQETTLPTHSTSHTTTDTSTTSSTSYAHGCDLDFDWDAEADYISDSDCGVYNESPSKTGTKSVQQALAEGYTVAGGEVRAGTQKLETATKKEAREQGPDSDIFRSGERGGNGADVLSTGVAGFKEYRNAKGKIHYVPTNEDPWW